MLAMRTILYPTDFSTEARPAFALACVLAGEGRGRLVILHVELPPLATCMSADLIDTRSQDEGIQR